MPSLFVLISYYFKPLTEIKTNYEQIEAEAAKKLRTMSLGKVYWFLQKKTSVYSGKKIKDYKACFLDFTTPDNSKTFSNRFSLSF